MIHFVYFARGEESGSVKIGFSMNPEKRVGMLRHERGERLELLSKVPMRGRRSAWLKEQRLHWHFDHLRISGEWFTPEPELMRVALSGVLPDSLKPKQRFTLIKVMVDPTVPRLLKLMGVDRFNHFSAGNRSAVVLLEESLQ